MAKVNICFYIFVSLFFISCTHIEKDKNTKIQNSYYPFKEGFSFFKKGDLDQARVYFEKIHKKQRYFIPSILEIQKINYLQQKWDQFFGLAWYYREVLLSSSKVSSRNFKQEMLALEMLALVKHCFFEEAEKVMKWGIIKAKSLNANSLKIRQAALFSQKFIGENQKKIMKKKSWKDYILFWPLREYQLQWLDNPKNLRVKIKSKC